MSDPLVTVSTTFGLIALAEMGDKSQLVCMSLAARHRALPVLAGAVTAFALLNLLAVVFGAALGAWLPERVVAGLVAILFAVFGVRGLLLSSDEEEGTDGQIARGHWILLSTLGLIFMAEFGDKTQLAVAGLAGHTEAVPVWLGATLALTLTSCLGVLAGRTVLQRIPTVLLHRLSGGFFLLLALIAALRALGIG
jgi:putative Ca2+/H+ antiporter (TMEM165/GDT1 family)